MWVSTVFILLENSRELTSLQFFFFNRSALRFICGIFVFCVTWVLLGRSSEASISPSMWQQFMVSCLFAYFFGRLFRGCDIMLAQYFSFELLYFRLFCKSAVISDVFFNKFAREFAARPARTDSLAHAWHLSLCFAGTMSAKTEGEVERYRRLIKIPSWEISNVFSQSWY